MEAATVPLRLLFILLLSLAGCANQVPIVPSQAIPAADSSFGAALEARAAEHQGHSGFRLLPASNEAFAARAELIRAAQHSLDLQYYIVHDGLSTRALVKELLQAADRGVRIRFLLDDTTSDGKDYQIALLAAHPNIQIRVFNPLHLGRMTGVTRMLGRGLNLSQQHRRMHNKLWLADSAAAIVGGRNLGDEYFDAEPNMNFTDIDMLAVGPVARDLSQSFDQYWNSSLSKPIEQFVWQRPSQKDLGKARKGLRDYLDTARVEQPTLYKRLLAYQQEPQLQKWLGELIWAPGTALWDAPSKVLASGEPDPHLLLTTQLGPHLQATKSDLVMVSAYFVPAQAGLEFLTGLADRDVDIRLLTNALEATDVPAVHGGYAPYRQEMLEHGIRLFELRRQPGADSPPAYSFSGGSDSSLHSKALVIDRQKSFVGSFNVDPRSVLWNTEVGVLVDSPKLAAYLRELALQGMKPSVSYEVRLQPDGNGTRMVWVGEDDGKAFELHEEPGNRWRHFNAWFSRAIGLEKML
ncbi:MULTISPECIES: phospholipase D family protein [Pseudomonadaceae]|uniref:phospholipase D family protein n=1 Tax=Pseudomonadaceae TaxID=135621 RepID=UPI0015CEAE40|nr:MULTISPECIES: phospholipase D family protein [Pseudomonas]